MAERKKGFRIAEPFLSEYEVANKFTFVNLSIDVAYCSNICVRRSC